jgi:hypothetical protein
MEAYANNLLVAKFDASYQLWHPLTGVKNAEGY